MNTAPTQHDDNHFSDKLLAWFDQCGRKDLPWQQNKTPYRVWVSEIMLQQTQVQSVIGYYQRFMESFPTLESLAKAEIDQVLEHWSGLGYYARARNLHKTAQHILSEHDGTFPSDHDELVALPGIGRSTASAIRSIAFKQPATILDGNVKRVLCRYDLIEQWSGERETEKKLWQRAETLTPTLRNDDYTQAIMDLGATCCTRSKPKCNECPMNDSCQTHAHGLQDKIPVSKPKKSKPTKHKWLLEIEHQGKILVEKRPPSGIWGGLYSLPEYDHELSLPELLSALHETFGWQTEQHTALDSFKHVFSHYTVIMHPVLIKTRLINASLEAIQGSYQWLDRNATLQLGLPAPIKKYLQQSCMQAELSLE